MPSRNIDQESFEPELAEVLASSAAVSGGEADSVVRSGRREA